MSAPPLPKYRVDESNTIGVLLVSPNSRLRLQLREKLRQPRWNLTEAAGGAEALEFLHERLSEMLLLDPLLVSATLVVTAVTVLVLVPLVPVTVELMDAELLGVLLVATVVVAVPVVEAEPEPVEPAEAREAE